jgi:hypothetical protein
LYQSIPNKKNRIDKLKKKKLVEARINIKDEIKLFKFDDINIKSYIEKTEQYVSGVEFKEAIIRFIILFRCFPKYET